ncbi:MAG: 50S ribosomal protein L3 [Candidatus Woesearchaeota archaeon]|nr:50S ribosomal protein L3 [Candidatus Woesearchaeota archaeon]
MGTKRNPRRGSMQYWPRKRAKREYARVRTWPKSDKTCFLGFPGYKVGMTHMSVLDNNKNSMTKGQEIFMPGTVIECPAIKILCLRFYKKSKNKLLADSDVLFKVDKEVRKKLSLPKKINSPDLENFEKNIEDYADVRAIIYTQPKKTNIGQKKPEVFELGIGGQNPKEKLEFVKQFIGKEIKITDVFQTGQQLDVKGITKGKGFQGTTKRFGTKVRTRKTEKAKRGTGTLGPWHPHRVRFTVAQPGKMGYHSRTDRNKWLLKIGENPDEINVKGGFLHYGKVVNNYVIVKGSVMGPAKRMIIMTKAMRPNKLIPNQAPQITYVSLESKQKN